MVKQLIMPARSLLLHNVSKGIQYAQAIYDFPMLAQYVLHDNKTLRYIEYALYKLEKSKIAFEYYQSINFKLCRTTFNYLKFYTISQFV